MRDITCFSANTVAKFDNNYDNMLQFNELMLNASRGNYGKYSKEEADKILRNQFNDILGIDFKTATPTKRRQAYRAHRIEIYALIEDVLIDKMQSGWNEGNARFMDYVETKNLALDDENEFYVADNSLLQVSKFAGDHHDIVRQALRSGTSYRVPTSKYVIKVYTEFELFMLGKVDWNLMVSKMYDSIQDYRYSALYTAFMSMDQSLPSDMILETPLTEATKDAVIDQIEAVKAATGRDVLLVGTRTAIQKLQNTINYNMFSNDMKNERYQNGILGLWEGYECLALSRVNKQGTRDSVFSADDNKKIFILPVDSDFKPIKVVSSGDVEYIERDMTGNDFMDRTLEADVRYEEGIGVIINQLFGEIKIATSVSA